MCTVKRAVNVGACRKDPVWDCGAPLTAAHRTERSMRGTPAVPPIRCLAINCKHYKQMYAHEFGCGNLIVRRRCCRQRALGSVIQRCWAASGALCLVQRPVAALSDSGAAWAPSRHGTAALGMRCQCTHPEQQNMGVPYQRGRTSRGSSAHEGLARTMHVRSEPKRWLCRYVETLWHVLILQAAQLLPWRLSTAAPSGATASVQPPRQPAWAVTLARRPTTPAGCYCP